MKVTLVTLLVSLIVAVSHANAAEAAMQLGNHPFEKVQIDYPSGEGCSFQYSPIQFCDERHVDEIKRAIAAMAPNFNHHYILLIMLERKKYYEHSVVAIDSKTGIAYPLPFDSYSGDVDAKGNIHGYGHILYDLNSNRVCISGAIVAYRQIDSGKLCWSFDGAKFVGRHTPYME
ncbi:hypothetical protein [Trinickia sp. Y13]|uniref:hypothetical protein n=1 Tax=Trinickia sp. Y13 TaxID=2917807 RepID=UPI002406E853|nr:hypothetical protein [Trinickia sp. Y13]MDG0027901.1 hypothetical protein [Trinickia sp. Y13]